jgi:hypothetical protein
VINEAFARRFFKNENPLGQHFGPDKIQYASKYEIVGVVKDMRFMTYDYKDPIGPISATLGLGLAALLASALPACAYRMDLPAFPSLQTHKGPVR